MPYRRLTLAALACFFALALPAQDLVPDGRTEGQGSAARLVLAQRVYAQALRDGDALALVAAIRLARSVTLRPATGWEKTSTGTDDTSGPPLQGPDPGSDIALTIARNLAAEDPGLQDLVYDLGAQVPHVPNLTAVIAESRLSAGESDTWRLPLFGSVPAELAVIGFDGGLLSLRIMDQAEGTACTRTATTDPQLCRFTPLLNGFYSVTVSNEGATPAGYRLIGN